MPLNDGYGVLVGTLHSYYRDNPNSYGQYYHGNIEVSAPAGIYRCAVDVDSKSIPNGVEWRTVELGAGGAGGVAALTSGWHLLVSSPGSGALDYIRSPELRARLGCVFVMRSPFLEWLRRLIESQPGFGWKQGTSIDALADLEPLLNSPKRLLVFGEPFKVGLGVHNIHQNQGDPAGSQWWAENGIWQDGATIIERQNGSYVAFINKFKTQTYTTDSQGHPI